MMCYTCTNDICYVCIFSSFFWMMVVAYLICGFALDHNIEYTIIYLFNIILPIYTIIIDTTYLHLPLYNLTKMVVTKFICMLAG